MTKIKNIAAGILLLILTIGIVAFPVVANSLSFKNMTKTYWYNEISDAGKLTSRNIIDLLKNPYRNENPGLSAADDKAVKLSVSSLFDRIFIKDTEMCRYLKGLASNDIKYSQSYELASIENTPVVLNMITAFIFGKDEIIELSFEAKTKTLIWFSCRSNDKTGKITYANELYRTLTAYYENDLKLDTKQYFAQTDRKSFLDFKLFREIQAEIAN